MSKLRTIADILLEAGADPLATSVAGRAPLHELFGHPATVALRPQSKNMRTPAENQIDYFSQKERRAVLRSLIHWGADALQPDRNQGFTPMHYCAREDADECMMDFLSFLNVAGPSDAQGETQERGNHRNRKAVRDSRVERQKCGPYYRCYNGRTCLHTACVSSAFSVVNLLARWDADYAIIGSIRMCLQLARASKSFHLPEDEIQHDEYCLTTIRDCNGKTPAQLFGQRGRDESIITFWERCFSGDLAR